MAVNIQNLKDRRCIPCEGGMKPFDSEAVARYATEVPLWEVGPDNKSISRQFVFLDFKAAIGFVNEVADLAEFEGHHPDINVKWNKVLLTLSTHAIKGLSENDFILAAKIDQID